jgi:hypothetical protein
MLRYNINGETNISLTAATAKTLAAVSAPSTRKARLLGFTVSFDSVTSTDQSVLVEVVRYTGTAGTATSRTPVALDPDFPAALCSGFVNYSAEPGTPTVLYEMRGTPVGGTLVIPFVPDEAPMADISQIVGVRCTSPQAQSNVRVSLTYEE